MKIITLDIVIDVHQVLDIFDTFPDVKVTVHTITDCDYSKLTDATLLLHLRHSFKTIEQEILRALSEIDESEF